MVVLFSTVLSERVLEFSISGSDTVARVEQIFSSLVLLYMLASNNSSLKVLFLMSHLPGGATCLDCCSVESY